MPVKGKEITTITLKEELQVYYNGYTNIKHINVPLAYTDNGDISISKITKTDGTVYVETDYGETWAIPISNIAAIIYKDNTETTPEINSDKSFPTNVHIEGKKISSEGEDQKSKFIKLQDRLYPTEPINAYEFFKNNQEQLSHGNYPFNAGIYKSTLRRNDRVTHAFVLDNAYMDVNELEQAFLVPISLHELTYKKLLYVTQDDKGNYVMVIDASTDWDNPNYRGLDPEIFK